MFVEVSLQVRPELNSRGEESQTYSEQLPSILKTGPEGGQKVVNLQMFLVNM